MSYTVFFLLSWSSAIGIISAYLIGGWALRNPLRDPRIPVATMTVATVGVAIISLEAGLLLGLASCGIAYLRRKRAQSFR
jgi:hypothetical protein